MYGYPTISKIIHNKYMYIILYHFIFYVLLNFHTLLKIVTIMHSKSTYFKNTTQYSSNNIHNYPPYFFQICPF